MIARFGIVDLEKRAAYEKEYHVPFGYEFISFNEQEAITSCRNLINKGRNVVVEKIYDTPAQLNNREVIYK